MDFLPLDLQKYVEDHSNSETELLSKLNRETHQKVMMPRMLSGHLQGRVLSMISHMIQPNLVLEIGTYTGYSAICLSEGLQTNGILHTIDINEELKSMCQHYFEKADISKQVCQHTGNALDIIPSIEGSFDLVFIDADKENYSNYFDLVIDQVSTGGFIIADNVLWSGKVVEDEDKNDLETKSLKDFNKKIHQSERVENILLPIRDGLMVCRKIK